MQDRWQGSNVLKVAKEESPASLVLYPVKILSQIEVSVRTVSDVQKAKSHHHTPTLTKVRGDWRQVDVWICNSRSG